jgi:flagellum-specific peptidoglycan hydrolase FlgJ
MAALRLLDAIPITPRTILHVSACVAVLVTAAVAVASHRPTTLESSQTATQSVAPPPALEQLAAEPPTELTPGEVSEAIDVVASAPPPEIQDDAPPLAMRTYVVEPGDSVRTIAQQFNVTNETVIWQNDLTDPDYVMIGQVLEILPFSGLIHEVRPGDTVASVANGYEALIEDVIKVNRLTDPYIIVVGQKLAVPGGYRALPQKVVAPSPPADTVQSPPDEDGQQAAGINIPRRSLPQLGNTPQERFIASIAEAAVVSHERTGIPASVTISQAILETYWGSSRLAREANNYFSIKAHTRHGPAGVVWFNVWEVIGGRNVMQQQPFRAYNSIAESFVDFGRFFVENGRYAAALAARQDPKQFAREINRAGYATDPAYASKVIALMDRYNLYRYDDV